MLEYFALAVLMISLTGIFYVFIFIHDLPHRVAKKRNHPQADAIHYACWLSLFTLHAIWPLVFLWAVSNKMTVAVALEGSGDGTRVAELERALRELQGRLSVLERAKGT